MTRDRWLIHYAVPGTYDDEGGYKTREVRTALHWPDAYDYAYSLADKGWFELKPIGVPPIDKFDGEYRWLSNFWQCPVVYENVLYPSVEHAYQAAKASDPRYVEMIRTANTPGRAKWLGRQAPQRSEWTADERLRVMAFLLVQKFRPGTHLAQLLEATGDRELIEGNHWGDNFWGVDTTRGEYGCNYLGELLMKIREDNRAG